MCGALGASMLSKMCHTKINGYKRHGIGFSQHFFVNHRNMGPSPTTHILAKLNSEKKPKMVISNLPRPSKTGWGGENWGQGSMVGQGPFHFRSWWTLVENRNVTTMTGVHPMYQEFTTIVIAIVIIITTTIILFNLLIWLNYHHHWFFINIEVLLGCPESFIWFILAVSQDGMRRFCSWLPKYMQRLRMQESRLTKRHLEHWRAGDLGKQVWVVWPRKDIFLT